MRAKAAPRRGMRGGVKSLVKAVALSPVKRVTVCNAQYQRHLAQLWGQTECRQEQICSYGAIHRRARL